MQYIVKIYKNGTIRLPKEVLRKLNLNNNSKLVLEESTSGFVVCKMEDYNNFIIRLNQELDAVDLKTKQQFKSIMKILTSKSKENK